MIDIRICCKHYFALLCIYCKYIGWNLLSFDQEQNADNGAFKIDMGNSKNKLGLSWAKLSSSWD